MASAIDRLRAKVELARTVVAVPAHPRVKNGHIEQVDAYTYTREGAQKNEVPTAPKKVTPEAWAQALSTEQMDALMMQGTSGYRAVNAFMRGGEAKVKENWKRDQGYDLPKDEFDALMGEVRSRIEQIDGAFATAPPLDQPRTTHRGMILPEGFTPVPGTRFSDKAYVSTSENPEAAEEFAGYYMEPEGDIPAERIAIVEVRLPKGLRTIDMNEVWKRQNPDGSLTQFERETLLNRDTAFVVKQARQDDEGRWRLVLEVADAA